MPGYGGVVEDLLGAGAVAPAGEIEASDPVKASLARGKA
jgi:hypothetical protein